MIALFERIGALFDNRIDRIMRTFVRAAAQLEEHAADLEDRAAAKAEAAAKLLEEKAQHERERARAVSVKYHLDRILNP